MAVVDGQASQLPAWLPGLPLGTPQAALLLTVFLGAGYALFLIARGRRLSKQSTR